FTKADDALKEPKIWSNVSAMLLASEMPPEGARKPSNPQRTRFLRSLSGFLPKITDCKQIASDRTQNYYKGHVMSRRLTRLKYHNTTRDLSGLALQLSARLPADGGGGEGFDTTGDALFSSAIHVEKYLATAETILRTVLKTGETPAVKRTFTKAQ